MNKGTREVITTPTSLNAVIRPCSECDTNRTSRDAWMHQACIEEEKLFRLITGVAVQCKYGVGVVPYLTTDWDDTWYGKQSLCTKHVNELQVRGQRLRSARAYVTLRLAFSDWYMLAWLHIDSLQNVNRGSIFFSAIISMLVIVPVAITPRTCAYIIQ